MRFFDVLDIKNGKNQKQVENPNGKYPIYGSGGIMGWADSYICDAHTVIIGRKGTINNPIYVDRPFWNVDTAFGLVARKEVLLPKYLFYFCCNFDFEKLNTTVTIPSLTKSNLLNIEINIPSLEEQGQIVGRLERVDELIDLRKQQLEQLDQLVKSRFIELFGDPETNPMKWDKVNISAVVGGKVTNGFFAKRDDYCEDGNVQVLGVANVVNRMYSNIEDLPKTNGTESDIKKYGVKYGDMLFCRSSLVAAGIGKASIVSHSTPSNVLFECHVIRLPLDLTKCIPEFMQVLSTTEFFRKQIISQSKTATMTTIGQDGIMKSTIILPPMELQKQFLSFVEHTDKLKFVVKEFTNERFNYLFQTKLV